MAEGPKRLSDFYVVSKDVDFTDPDSGETVKVMIVKLNDPDTESMLRKASAAQAKVLMDRNNPDSEGYLETYAAVAAIEDPEVLASWVIADEVAKLRISAAAKLASEGKWGKDDYYPGLLEAWADGLRERWENDPTDEEGARVFAELKSFNDEVEAEVQEARDDLLAIHAQRPMPDLHDQVTKIMLDIAADHARKVAINEYRIYYSVRQPSKGPVSKAPRYFESIDEIRATHEMIRKTLEREYDAMAVEGIEGKGLPVDPASSPPSEPSVPAAV
jgi:hypothetical protein